MKKLKKCRDPDRFDLITLHKKRLEFREKEAGAVVAKNSIEDDGAVFGGGGGGGGGTGEAHNNKGDLDRESKRRKVASEDPFGPAL